MPMTENGLERVLLEPHCVRVSAEDDWMLSHFRKIRVLQASSYTHETISIEKRGEREEAVMLW